MEIDIINAVFDLKHIKPREVEECLEDPYALRVLPEVEHGGSSSTRYYLIGKTLHGRGLFLSFATNGKVANIIFAREASELEIGFYERSATEV